MAPACRPASRSDTGFRATSASVPQGGELIVSIRTEPRSFNRLAARDTSTDLIGPLLHAKLVRINHATPGAQPWLPASWARSDDGLQYAVKLRPNVTSPAGHPASA